MDRTYAIFEERRQQMQALGRVARRVIIKPSAADESSRKRDVTQR